MPREPEQPLEPDPVIEAYKKDIDRTLIRENLKLTPTERGREAGRAPALRRGAPPRGT
jgi:hypothetical protein